VQGNLELKEATIFDQTLRDIHSKVVVTAKEPDFLVLQNLIAQLHGGAVGGEVRVGIGPQLTYEAHLTALGLHLEEISRANDLGPSAQQSGLLNAQLTLNGRGAELTGLKGSGGIDVPSGKMYNLPLLLDLLKFLSLRLPDRTLFEEAHVRFVMDGPRVEINRFDLLGAAFSLGGRGTFDLNSRAYNMELYAVWGRIVQLSPPLIRELWPKLSEKLLKIKMTGKLGETPQFKEELVPPLSEPLERVLEQLGGRASG
jgi:hypothetical protein